MLFLKNDCSYIERIENQTEELCIFAVKQNPDSVLYVRNLTTNIIKAVLEIDPDRIDWFEQTPELCVHAIKHCKKYSDKFVNKIKIRDPSVITALYYRFGMKFNDYALKQILFNNEFLLKNLKFEKIDKEILDHISEYPLKRIFMSNKSSILDNICFFHEKINKIEVFKEIELTDSIFEYMVINHIDVLLNSKKSFINLNKENTERILNLQNDILYSKLYCKTYPLCELNFDKIDLEYVEDENIYTEIGVKIYLLNKNNIIYINKNKVIANWFFRNYLSKNGNLIEILSEEKRTYELLYIAYCQNPEMIKYVPFYWRIFF